MSMETDSAPTHSTGKVRSVIRMSNAGLTAGTLIMTSNGQRVVEDLKRGDRILTKDFGYQSIKCIGFRDVDLRRSDTQAPIKLAADCLGHQRPLHDLYVAPCQRLAIRHPLFDPIFGTREVVACAGDLLSLVDVEQVKGLKGITYVMLGFSRPQLVLTGSLVLDLGAANGDSARLVLSKEEARLACGLLNPHTHDLPDTGIALH